MYIDYSVSTILYKDLLLFRYEFLDCMYSISVYRERDPLVYRDNLIIEYDYPIVRSGIELLYTKCLSFLYNISNSIVIVTLIYKFPYSDSL